MAGSIAEPRWIDRLIAEAIHWDQIRSFGGIHGLRDETGLDSALARPRNRWSHEELADLASLAAAYGYGLSRNHPFNDGNKRTSFVVTATFTELNGYVLDLAETEVVEQMLALASGDLTELEHADWIRRHLSAQDQ